MSALEKAILMKEIDSAVSKDSAQPAVLMSHPTGNQYVRNALRSLVERNMLAEFWTSLAWDSDSRWNQLLPTGIRRQMARRSFAEAPRGRVKCAPWAELVRLGARSTWLEGLLCSGERPFSVVGMFRKFDARVARRLRDLRIDAVYAHEGGALQTFRQAKQQGIATLYELPSGHWYWERDLLRREAERNPKMATVIPKLTDSEAHMREKDEEIELADVLIVCSEHIRRTLAGAVPDDKIKVIPYGAPPVRFRQGHASLPGAPLRVLFAGALHQRKGIGYLLEAIDLLGSNVELTLIGQRLAANPIVDAACRRWRWFESLPHSGVLDVMMDSDVLVLPSLSEGFGLVVTEALACGLPVIVTPNVGASDLVCDGREGFVVPVCSVEGIAGRLNRLHQDRDLLAGMSQNAQTVAARHSWENYRQTWAETVKAASWR
jgi:glycosyltransferase involved in cell wall biosynthesis